MDDPVLTEYVVHQLGRNVSQNDLIYDLCQRTGASWEQVSRFVSEVEQKHQRVIARKQSPLYFVIGIGIFLGGIFLFCWAFTSLIRFVGSGNISLNPLDLRRDYFTVIRLGTGLAMMIGSAIGMVRLLISIMAKPAPKV